MPPVSRLASILAAVLALALAAGCAAPPDRTPLVVKLIGLNDYHGHLESPGRFGENLAVPAAERPPVGGAAALAVHVDRLRAANPHHAVVGAGDFVGASPLVSSMFHDEPAVETLNRIGLEFNAVGNHEFDHGLDELLRLQRGGCKRVDGQPSPTSCRGAEVGTPVPFEGARYRWLAANVVHRATGEPVLPAYAVKRFDGVPVAFVGMTLRGTASIVPAPGIAGVEFRDEAATVNALVPTLRAQGVEAIVLLLHQGGDPERHLADINGCDGDLAGSPLARIVAKLDDAVDVVISGHTHQVYNCSANTVDVRTVDGRTARAGRTAGLPNAAGRRVPVTSAGSYGRVLTDMDLEIDRSTRDVRAVRPVNRLVTVDEAAARTPVASIVERYRALAAPLADRIVGRLAGPLRTTADAAGNHAAGEFAADAQLAATASAGAMVAFVNAGGLRGAGFVPRRDGSVTFGDVFTVQPFGNRLVTATFTVQQLKDLLERQFPGCRGQTVQRVLSPSRGFSYAWVADAPCGRRIRDVRWQAPGEATQTWVDAAGRLLEPNRPVRITLNDYLANGGDRFELQGQGRDAVVGARDVDAIARHLEGFAVQAYAHPESPPRIVRRP